MGSGSMNHLIRIASMAEINFYIKSRTKKERMFNFVVPWILILICCPTL